jgi:hypothetical protein
MRYTSLAIQTLVHIRKKVLTKNWNDLVNTAYAAAFLSPLSSFAFAGTLWRIYFTLIGDVTPIVAGYIQCSASIGKNGET